MKHKQKESAEDLKQKLAKLNEKKQTECLQEIDIVLKKYNMRLEPTINIIQGKIVKSEINIVSNE